MVFDISHIALLGVTYLMLLLLVAHAANAGWIPKAITNHPITYVLSMGISFSALSFYGLIDLAHQFGYGALAYYMGTGAFFLFAPVIQAPLAELCQRFQLRSIADLLVFRYNSQLAGGLATLFIFLAILPLLVLQIQAVADTLQILTQVPVNENTDQPEQNNSFGLFYCLLIAAFCMVFGTGYRSYKPLIATMAVESLVKVLALMAIGTFSVVAVFGGLDELDKWLINNEEHLIRLYSNEHNRSSHTLLLVFIATGVLMPHIYYMGHMGQSIKQVARTITWAFPLFLLFMALPVFPILWAGFKLQVELPISYFTLAVPQYTDAPILTLVAWLGGLSAASGALAISVLPLSTMMLNQWLLPVLNLDTHKDIYAQLRWLRRALILAIVTAGYLIFLWLNRQYSLVDLALLTFIEALQFVPGVVAINYWPRANRQGFFAGLITGSLVWLFGLAIPTMLNWTSIEFPLFNTALDLGIEHWESITLLAIGCNLLTFFIFSYLTQISEEEQYHADICAEDELSHPFRRVLDVTSAKDFETKLSDTIGADAAAKEVNRALQFLGIADNETRPYLLRRLRTRIRTNLSALLGHAIAADIIDKHFPYRHPNSDDVFDINLMENRLERMGNKMQGLTADVNQLRLHHRKTLQELPIAICSLGMDDEILLWNNAMANITGINSKEITGSNLHELPDPWGELIREFANDWQTHINKQSIHHNSKTYWYRLHKSASQGFKTQRTEGQVILIEDITDIQLMEQELTHNTRLASIGRLAAGVAHEIGNPITGIACLAQNLRYEEKPEERIETADAILSQIDRIDRIVKSLVTFAHTGKTQQKDYQAVAIHQCINEAIHLLSLQRERKQIEYRNLSDPLIKVWGDNQRLIQVFINLLSNANDASPEFSTITIRTLAIDKSIRVDTIDEGSGISQENIEQVMDPFFTTKEAGNGTGLGLSVVFNIIEEHGGHISITSPVAQNKGTCISIHLPTLEQSKLK